MKDHLNENPGYHIGLLKQAFDDQVTQLKLSFDNQLRVRGISVVSQNLIVFR